MKIVIVNGYPQSGKDKFVDFCEQSVVKGGVARASSVDPAKEALKILGWDGVKTPETRRALSDLKDMSTELFDGPFKYVKKKIEEFENSGVEFAFFFAREPKELQRYREEVGATIIFISRGMSEEPSNHADRDVENFDYEYIVDNHGTLDDLKDQAKDFIEFLKLESD